MMRALLILSATILIGSPQKTTDIDRAPVLDRLCGKLVRSETVPLKGRFNTASVQQTSLSKTDIQLYKREQETICCENMHPITTAQSADAGMFEFKKVGGGPYWVVVHLDGHDYKMAVQYNPVASSATRCTDLMFEVEASGSFELGRVIPFPR